MGDDFERGEELPTGIGPEDAADDLEAGLDPKLWDLMASARDTSSALLPPGEAVPEVEVSVMAKLRDPDQAVPGLTVVRAIGPIVTGTVRISQIQAVREHGNVITLSAATEVSEELDDSVEEIRATPEQIAAAFPTAMPEINGSGVIVGIVDYDCDFAHKNFRHDDGNTRLLFLWNQRGGGGGGPPAGFDYGVEYDAAAINRALKASDPYGDLGYRPGKKGHGTHVMDIAAGNGRATGNPGVAPKADLIFVHVATDDYKDDQTLGDSRHLVEGVIYIFEKAAALGRQAVVNTSLGTHGGPHDGTTLVEEAFDLLLDEGGRAIVQSAGNYRTKRIHARGLIPAGATEQLSWATARDDETANELEIWYDGEQRLDLRLGTPNGKWFQPISLDNRVHTMRFKETNELAGRIIHRRSDLSNADNQIDILFDKRLYGPWTVELKNTGGEDVEFHAWIERDHRDYQSTFGSTSDPRTTTGSIACGRKSLVVGSYDPSRSGRPLSSFSSEGPTRDGRSKPDVSAPGHKISAARCLTQDQTTMSGTSMAAPHVTGLVALLMQKAGHPLTMDEIRTAVIDGARRNPPPAGAWHPRYGHGRVDAVASLGLI
jgi:subtilisin family serine protease